jgi:hypothetical protein
MNLCRAPSQNARQTWNFVVRLRKTHDKVFCLSCALLRRTAKLTFVRRPLPPKWLWLRGVTWWARETCLPCVFWRRTTKIVFTVHFLSNARQTLFVPCAFVCRAFYCLTHGKGGCLPCARGTAHDKHFGARQSCCFRSGALCGEIRDQLNWHESVHHISCWHCK